MQKPINIPLMTACFLLFSVHLTAAPEGNNGGNLTKTFTVTKGGSLDVSVRCRKPLVRVARTCVYTGATGFQNR